MGWSMERLYIKDKRIEELEKELENKNNNVLIEFWNNIKKSGTPLIEDIDGEEEYSLVTLIYREKKELENVVFIPPVGMRKLENCKMDKIPNSDLWYIAYRVKKDIRFSYQFSPNDPLNNDWERRWKNVQDDEFNKNKLNFTGKVSDKYRTVPFVVLEKAKEHVWVKEYLTSPKGKIENFKIYSDILKGERDISIYTPNEYSEDNKPYGVLLLNDGFEYINILSAQNVLDNLIAKKEIPPIITVFVHATKDRAENLKCNDEFSKFLACEVMTYVEKEFNISNKSEDNIIGGYSLGGLAASYTALKYPHIFGNVLSQSGSYWYKRDDYKSEDKLWIINEFASIERLPIKFYINVGDIEPKISMIDTNVQFSEALNKLGYKVKFETFGSGHDYLCWGETLADGLKYLLGIN